MSQKKQLTNENKNDFWFVLEEHNNSENRWQVAHSWVTEALGIDNLQYRVRNLEEKIDGLEKPRRIQRILDVINVTEGFHTWGYYRNRISGFRYDEFMELAKEGKIAKEPNKPNMYGRKEEGESGPIA